MREVGRNSHAGLWTAAIDAKFTPGAPGPTRADFDQMLSGYEGLADYPAAIFPEELLAAYPEAPVILSTRSEDSWFTSMSQTLIHRFAQLQADDPSPMAAMSRRYQTECWGNDFEKNGRELFRTHNETVRRGACGKKFMEYQPGDGWEPLCQFLDVAVPEGVPYPRSDDWAAYKKTVAAQLKAAAGEQ